MTETKQDIVLDEWQEVMATALPTATQKALTDWEENYNLVVGAIEEAINSKLPTGFKAVVSLKRKWGKIQLSFKVVRQTQSQSSNAKPLPTQKLRVLGEKFRERATPNKRGPHLRTKREHPYSACRQ